MIIRGESRPELLRSETLPDIFEATARARRDQTALVDGARAISYGELDASADRIASMLITAGAGNPGCIVGLWLPRGAELLIAQLGITKSGAAWLPFDADTPAKRVAECLRAAGAVAVVTDAAHAATLSPLSNVPAFTVAGAPVPERAG